MDNTIYKLQEDYLAIQENERTILSTLDERFLIHLGFTLANPQSTLKRYEMSLQRNLIHVDVMDNRTFIFYLDNKHVPNVSTTRDLINLINLFK